MAPAERIERALAHMKRAGVDMVELSKSPIYISSEADLAIRADIGIKFSQEKITLYTSGCKFELVVKK